MKAVLRMLDDMDKLVVNALQELRIIQQEPDASQVMLCQCFTAIGALTTLAGAIVGARRAISLFV